MPSQGSKWLGANDTVGPWPEVDLVPCDPKVASAREKQCKFMW
jgi:hypothetical protein